MHNACFFTRFSYLTGRMEATMSLSRRHFIGRTVLAGGAMLAARTLPAAEQSTSVTGRTLVISSANGQAAAAKAAELLAAGADPLDAVIAGVNIVEDDPADTSVGYGGLPNEEGVVELDAAVMHGPTHRAGAVASLRNIRNPSRVARTVMERSDHVLLVGEGALRFARAHGFTEENLLTDQARRAWLSWKERLSPKDDWLPQLGPEDEDLGARFEPFLRSMGTIHCSALDTRGNVASVTTTSGLAFKIPGRVGDSPIIGAGLYCDNAVGAAGSTGRGEANLANCSSVMIVEWMRQGRTPEEACLEACRRIAANTRVRRLRDADGRPDFDVKFYALSREGAFGGASLYAGGRMVVAGEGGVRPVPMASLYPAARKS